MFDPTIFDNLKVVTEGLIYDMDLSGKIRIIERTDQVELAHMSRSYGIIFELADHPGPHAEIQIYAALADLASELLMVEGDSAGCALHIYFTLDIEEPEETCRRIQNALEQIWQERIIEQQISYPYTNGKTIFQDRIHIRFDRKISEQHIDDIPDLLEHVTRSLLILHEWKL